MKFRIPLVPFTVHVNVERRPRRRVTVLALMIVIAVLALAMGAARISKRWFDDWAYDRQEAAKHRHEGTFCLNMLQGIQSYRTQHPSDDKKIWVIHGMSYRVTHNGALQRRNITEAAGATFGSGIERFIRE
jgi:hypothetical protein